jgi:hypothetical protein
MSCGEINLDLQWMNINTNDVHKIVTNIYVENICPPACPTVKGVRGRQVANHCSTPVQFSVIFATRWLLLKWKLTILPFVCKFILYAFPIFSIVLSVPLPSTHFSRIYCRNIIKRWKPSLCNSVPKYKVAPLSAMLVPSGEKRYSSFPVLTSTSDGVSGRCHAPATLQPLGRGTPCTHWIGNWAILRFGLDAEARRKLICLCRRLNHGHPVLSQILYRPSYRGSYVYWVGHIQPGQS